MSCHHAIYIHLYPLLKISQNTMQYAVYCDVSLKPLDTFCVSACISLLLNHSTSCYLNNNAQILVHDRSATARSWKSFSKKKLQFSAALPAIQVPKTWRPFKGAIKRASSCRASMLYLWGIHKKHGISQDIKSGEGIAWFLRWWDHGMCSPSESTCPDLPSAWPLWGHKAVQWLSDLERTLQAIHLHGSESAHSREKNPRHKPTCDLLHKFSCWGVPRVHKKKAANSGYVALKAHTSLMGQASHIKNARSHCSI